MTNGIATKVKSKAKQAIDDARKAAKKIAREEYEGYTRSAKAQITGESVNVPEESGAEGISGGVSNQQFPDDHEKDKQMATRMMGELREELEHERVESGEKLKRWRQQQEEEMTRTSEDKETVVYLPSSPKKGPQGPGGPGGKGPKGTGEMLKPKK